MYSKLVRKVFSDKEYIIKEGDHGDEFYIILEGAANVEDSTHGTLASLHEGHCFGEMALLSDEPRVASVVAVGRCVCLCLAQTAFRAALSADKFSSIVNDMMKQRRETRMKREAARKSVANATFVSQRSSIVSMGGSDDPFPELNGLWGDPADGSNMTIGKSPLRTTGTFYTAGSEVTFSAKLIIKKAVNGDKYINKYKLLKEIGKGSFGSVYSCIDEKTNQMCAMKAVNRGTHFGSKVVILSEIEVMKYLNHKNLVALYGVIDDPSAKKIFIIQEFMSGGCLMNEDMTSSGNDGAPVPFADEQARKYFRDMLKGVHYLHSLGIIHRDIKPQNVLLDGDGCCKISDFGSAISIYSKISKKLAVAGTPAFMAPELFNDPTPEVQKTPGVDLFALGATLYCMTVGKPPWMAKDQIDLANRIAKFEVVYPLDCKIDPHLKHLLNHMMDKDCFVRFDIDAIINHDWVTKEGSEPLYGLRERVPSKFPLHSASTRQPSKVGGLAMSPSPSVCSLPSGGSDDLSMLSHGSGISGVSFPSTPTATRPHKAQGISANYYSSVERVVSAPGTLTFNAVQSATTGIPFMHNKAATKPPNILPTRSIFSTPNPNIPPKADSLQRSPTPELASADESGVEFALARDLDLLNERRGAGVGGRTLTSGQRVRSGSNSSIESASVSRQASFRMAQGESSGDLAAGASAAVMLNSDVDGGDIVTKSVVYLQDDIITSSSYQNDFDGYDAPADSDTSSTNIKISSVKRMDTAARMEYLVSVEKSGVAPTGDEFDMISVVSSDTNNSNGFSASSDSFSKGTKTGSNSNRLRGGVVDKLQAKRHGLTRTNVFEVVPTELTISATGEKVAKGIMLEISDGSIAAVHRTTNAAGHASRHSTINAPNSMSSINSKMSKLSTDLSRSLTVSSANTENSMDNGREKAESPTTPFKHVSDRQFSSDLKDTAILAPGKLTDDVLFNSPDLGIEVGARMLPKGSGDDSEDDESDDDYGVVQVDQAASNVSI
jgi:serine/threonine protein kinase